MQLRGRPSGLCQSMSRQSVPSRSRSVVCSFFGKKQQHKTPGITRKQYEDTIGGLLATALTSPAPTTEQQSQPPAVAPEHQQQNGHGLHVVKPEKRFEDQTAQEDSHAVPDSPSQTEAAASLQTAVEEEVAQPLAAAAELQLPVVEPVVVTEAAAKPVTGPKAGSVPADAKSKEQQTVVETAVKEAATKAFADPPVKKDSTPSKSSKSSKFAGKMQEQTEQAAGSAQQEGRVLKPTKARTEPKTSASKAKKVPQTSNPRNLVFVTAEVAPWSKTGGLGDVLGSLPIALAARGHRVMVVVPRYECYKEPVDTEKRIDIMGAEVGYFHHVAKGVDWVFVDHPSYPRPGGLYADEHGVYGDNQFRFMLLALAALEAPLQLPLGDDGLYGEDCVFIANDWHAALVPVYLAAKYRQHGVYTKARSVMAIHNLRHQGVFPPTTYASLGLPSNWYNALEYQYPPHMRQGSFAEEGRSVNMLKGGITTADRVVTVSPGYAGEIRTYLGGWGLEGLIDSRAYVLNGIVNGIDDEDWNPATDKHLPKKYNITNFKEGKRACKVALQEELGLPVNPDVPLIAFIGRLDYQKGADIVLQAAPWMMSRGVQLVCLGTGSTDLENGLRWLEAAYRDQARGWVGFNVAMSHKITAAADILLMPSRFEPCGLNQLYAMQYGTVPVAHRTGGLGDTVIDFNPEEQSGTGWTFGNCDASGLMHATGLALSTLKHHTKDFEGIQLRGMQRDSTWNGAAEQYEQIFEWALLDQPYA